MTRNIIHAEANSMSLYPMRVETWHGDHQSGTKSYTIIYLHCDDGSTVLINRFGKVSAGGQVSVQTAGDLEKICQKKVREKQGGGYDLRRSEESVLSEAELVLLIKRDTSSSIADTIRSHAEFRRAVSDTFYAPSSSSTETWSDKQKREAREKDRRMASERATMMAELEIRNREEAAARVIAQKIDDDERMKSNPLWGRF
jgi:hypothetical protein